MSEKFIIAFDDNQFCFSPIIRYYWNLYPDAFYVYNRLSVVGFPNFMKYLAVKTDISGHEFRLFIFLDIKHTSFSDFISRIEESSLCDIPAFKTNYFIFNLDEESKELLVEFNERVLIGKSSHAYCVGTHNYENQELSESQLNQLVNGYLFMILQNAFIYEEGIDPFFRQTNWRGEKVHYYIFDLLYCDVSLDKRIHKAMVKQVADEIETWYSQICEPEDINLEFIYASMKHDSTDGFDFFDSVMIPFTSYSALLTSTGREDLVERIRDQIEKSPAIVAQTSADFIKERKVEFLNKVPEELKNCKKRYLELGPQKYLSEDDFSIKKLEIFAAHYIERLRQKINKVDKVMPHFEVSDIKEYFVKERVANLSIQAVRIKQWKKKKRKMLVFATLSSLIFSVMLIYVFCFKFWLLSLENGLAYLPVTSIVSFILGMLYIYNYKLNKLLRKYRRSFKKLFQDLNEELKKRRKIFEDSLFAFLKEFYSKRVMHTFLTDLYSHNHCIDNLGKTLEQWPLSKPDFQYVFDQSTYLYPLYDKEIDIELKFDELKKRCRDFVKAFLIGYPLNQNSLDTETELDALFYEELRQALKSHNGRQIDDGELLKIFTKRLKTIETKLKIVKLQRIPVQKSLLPDSNNDAKFSFMSVPPQLQDIRVNTDFCQSREGEMFDIPLPPSVLFGYLYEVRTFNMKSGEDFYND